MGKVTDLGRESICAVINADLRHMTLSGHNSPTARNLVLYYCFLENRHPKLSWDFRISQFGPVWEK